jgi:hypothetical protein
MHWGLRGLNALHQAPGKSNISVDVDIRSHFGVLQGAQHVTCYMLCTWVVNYVLLVIVAV